MPDPLGLSIGTANLVSARVGNPPMLRRAMLTFGRGRGPQVGAPPAGSDDVVITGFVERVGDPIPLVASDGSQHRADRLMVEALAAMVELSGPPPWSITVAAPAYWTTPAVNALRAAMLTMPTLSPNGTVASTISDASAALTALSTDPGLPTSGIVALVDFGATGTTFTLADAGASFSPVGESVRYHEFSGDAIDQLLLTNIVNDLASDGVDSAATSATAAVGPLSRLREDCRHAKEALSSESATDVVVDLPSHRGRVRLTRAELESLIADPLTGVISGLRDMLGRNGISPSAVAGIATVGGVASIPVVTQRLSEEMRIPIVTTPRPELNAAAGAALHTASAPLADAPTGISTSAAMAPMAAEFGSSTFRALAWSQDEDAGNEPVPYTGENYVYTDELNARPPVQFVPPAEPPVENPPRWYRRPLAAVGLAALLPLIAVGAIAYALTGNERHMEQTPTSTAVVSAPASSAAPAPLPSSAPPLPSSAAPAIVATSPPPASPPPPPPATHTITQLVTPSPTTTTPPTTTTTTTTMTTSTTTTTTTTSTTTTTTTTPPMTTSYLTVPFVPVPIPVQVPAPNTPSYQQPYPYQPYQP